PADRIGEPAGRRRGTGLAVEHVERTRDLRGDHLLGLRRHDPREDVAVAHRFHRERQPRRAIDCVAATNCASLALAAPLAIVWRESAMPSAIESAMPAA